MKFDKLLSVTLYLSLNNVAISECYKILGIFHTSSNSHYIAGSALMKALAEKGHDVTVISPFPQQKPLSNFRDITIPSVKRLDGNVHPTDIVELEAMGIIKKIRSAFGFGLSMTNYTLSHEDFQHFLRDARDSDIHYDVIVMLTFMNEAFLGIGHYLKAPIVGFSSFGASKWTNDLVGSPTPLSYVPHHFLVKFADKMSFLERVWNVLAYVGEEFYMNWYYMPQQEKIYEATFPDPKPTLEELQKNVSLVLLNNHFSLSFPRPYVPNMIEVGGLQINRTPKPLPSDLQKTMDEAVHGVIYFSLETNIKAENIPAHKQIEILNAFRKLKQTVLWKWDGQLEGKPDNVHVSAWFPQDGLLAHPNLKIFITHGGLLSITETIYHAVPAIGIPLFADQHLNIAQAESAGIALSITVKDLGESTLLTAITEILSNDKYAKKVKLMSERYRDQPLTPLETAIYWTEYVARHKGAPHLRSAGLDLSLFVYHSLDVFSALLAAIYVTFRLIKFTFCRIIGKILKKNLEKSVNKKKVT